MSTLISITTLTKLLSVPEERVQELVCDGIIPKPIDGKYDFVSSVKRYVKYLREKISSNQAAETCEQELRLKLLKAQYHKEELEYKQLTGEFVSLEKAEAALLNRLTKFRTQMLAIPYRLSVAIKNPKDSEAVRSVLKELLDDALDELSGEIEV